MSNTTTKGPQGPAPGEQPPQPRALATPSTQRLSHEPLRQVKTLDSLFNNAEFRQRIAESVPKHVTPDRMLRTMVTAVQKAPLLAKADVRGLIGAFLTCSQCGLEPNTPLQHMHLIPFRKTKWNPATRQREEVGVEVQIIFGYQGLLELSYRSPLVTSIQANVVYDGDDFSYEYGTNAHLMHRPKGGGAAQGFKPHFAYMMAKLKDGFAFEVMPWADVLAIRNNSQAFRQALAAKEEAESKGRRPPATWTEAPWVKFDVAMGRKTVFRSGSKWLPRSVEMASVIAIDEAQERRRNIDWSNVVDVVDGDYVGAAAFAAETSGEEGGDDYGPVIDQGDEGQPVQQQDQRVQPTQQQGPARAAPPAPQQREAARATVAEDTGGEGPSRVFGGTAFGGGEDPPEREQGDPGPREDRAAAPAEAKPADPAPAETKPKGTRSRAAAQELPEFRFHVFDAYGEQLPGVQFQSRLDWANAYAAVWEGCDGEGMTEALAEFNAEAMTDAMQDKRAAKMIEGLSMPTVRMRKIEEERLASEKAADEAAAAKLAAEAAPAQKDGPDEKDRDLEWARGMVGDSVNASISDVHAMIAHVGIRNTMKRLATERPELHAMVEKAFAARLAKKQ